MTVGRARWFIGLLLLTLQLWALPAMAAPPVVPPGTVVRIFATKAGGQAELGAGFFFTADGRVATAYHVVQGSTKLQLFDERLGVLANPRIVAADELWDLAILQVDVPAGQATPFLSPAPESDLQGHRGHAVGHPNWKHNFAVDVGFPRDASVEAASWVISDPKRRAFSFDAERAHVMLIPLDGTLDAGMSGGPVLLEDGRVVGVVGGSEVVRGAALGWAIPFSRVLAMKVLSPTPPGLGQAPLRLLDPGSLARLKATEPVVDAMVAEEALLAPQRASTFFTLAERSRALAEQARACEQAIRAEGLALSPEGDAGHPCLGALTPQFVALANETRTSMNESAVRWGRLEAHIAELGEAVDLRFGLIQLALLQGMLGPDALPLIDGMNSQIAEIVVARDAVNQVNQRVQAVNAGMTEASGALGVASRRAGELEVGRKGAGGVVSPEQIEASAAVLSAIGTALDRLGAFCDLVPEFDRAILVFAALIAEADALGRGIPGADPAP